MKNCYRYLLMLAMVLASCTREKEEATTPQKQDFTADIEEIDNSRTYINDGYQVLWSDGDRISVFEKSTVADEYRLKEGSGGTTSGSFEYVRSTSMSEEELLANTIAWYPWSDDVRCTEGDDPGSYRITAVLPEVQRYSAGSVGADTLPMVAVTGDESLRKLMFYNVCGVLRLQLKGESTVQTISLTGNSDEKLSGNIYVTAYYDGGLPSTAMAEDAEKDVYLDCTPGVGLSKTESTDFFIVVPPVEFSKGFTVRVTDTEGRTTEFRTSVKNPVGRAKVLKMPEVTIEEESAPEPVPSITDPGIAYMWDESVIPEITIRMTEDEWNKLLFRYDEFSHNVDYFHADFTYKKGSEVTEIIDGGIRLRGNTSRRRPEGNYGQAHDSRNPDWHHCHFGINFRKYHKDKDHEIEGIRKVNLKWFKDDPNYVRELYCYDLFRRYGIWTAAFDVYCRVWLQVGDAVPAYLGVYEMIEPIDDKYVEKRIDGMFGSEDGFLWKCVYGEGGMADLRTDGGNAAPYWKMNWDQDNGINYTYEFKGDEEDFEAAKIQLGDFMQKLNGKGEESFYKWIKEVCDVEFLLRTYAVNVVVGMCDDHWNNGNNFYLYFNTTDQYKYELFFLPYDYDNTLGTSWNVGVMSDSGRQDPYNWGDGGLLMERLMKFEEFRQIYRNALQELVAAENGLFHVDASIPRIRAWQEKIAPYVWNDTGEDMEIYDGAAYWGNNQNYKLLTKGSGNFFEVKAQTVNSMR